MSRDSIRQPQLLLIRRPPLLLGESIRPGDQQGWKQKVNDCVVQLCCLKQSKPLLTSVTRDISEELRVSPRAEEKEKIIL